VLGAGALSARIIAWRNEQRQKRSVLKETCLREGAQHAAPYDGWAAIAFVIEVGAGRNRSRLGINKHLPHMDGSRMESI